MNAAIHQLCVLQYFHLSDANYLDKLSKGKISILDMCIHFLYLDYLIRNQAVGEENMNLETAMSFLKIQRFSM